MNKYQYLYVLQGNYGFGDGWEDLSTYQRGGGKEARSDLRAYRREERTGTYRIIERRVLNTRG